MKPHVIIFYITEGSYLFKRKNQKIQNKTRTGKKQNRIRYLENQKRYYLKGLDPIEEILSLSIENY
jgi:hypothetical protein